MKNVENKAKYAENINQRTKPVVRGQLLCSKDFINISINQYVNKFIIYTYTNIKCCW